MNDQFEEKNTYCKIVAVNYPTFAIETKHYTPFTTPTQTLLPTTAAYRSRITTALGSKPSFADIIRFQVNAYQANGSKDHFDALLNGTVMIRTAEQATAYLAAYGDMHRIKLDSAFQMLFTSMKLEGQKLELFDWGCGQGLASGVLLDFMRLHGIDNTISRINLIEPSQLAISLASAHLGLMVDEARVPFRLFNQKADTISAAVLTGKPAAVKIHLFANVLDMLSVDYKAIARTIRKSQQGLNIFVCVSPLIRNGIRDCRLSSFRQEFTGATVLSQRTDSLTGLIYGILAKRPMMRMIQRNECIFSVQL